MNQTLPDGWSVTIQSTTRTRGRREKWGYVIHQPGWAPHVSAYRWSSPEAAERAGIVDALATATIFAVPSAKEH